MTFHDDVVAELESAVWRAIATKAAHASRDFEVDLRVICERIRRIHQQTKTVVVPPDFPTDYDPGFPAVFVRSSYCPSGTAYIIPDENDLHDLLRGRP